MNQKNNEEFFGNEDQSVVLTLEDEEGGKMDVELIAHLEIEELQKEYVAATPTEEDDDEDGISLVLLSYSEDKYGNPEFDLITDEDEYNEVFEAFTQILSELNEEDDDDDDYVDSSTNGDGLLDGLDSYIPGITFDK